MVRLQQKCDNLRLPYLKPSMMITSCSKLTCEPSGKVTVEEDAAPFPTLAGRGTTFIGAGTFLPRTTVAERVLACVWRLSDCVRELAFRSATELDLDSSGDCVVVGGVVDFTGRVGRGRKVLRSFWAATA